VTVSLLKKLGITFRNPWFWIILAFFVLITIPHYLEALSPPIFLTNFLTSIGLTRHAFERILYLVPISLAGLFFGWRGSFITSLLALALMIPRDFYLSKYQADAFFETGAVFIVGNVLAVTFGALHKERKQHIQLEVTHNRLKESEEKYRYLFEKAHDSILIHDLEGNIVVANKACLILTGYTIEELQKIKMMELLSDESWLITGAMEQLLLSGEDVEDAFEAKLIKKSKNEASISLSIGLGQSQGQTTAFQCTIQDISEQKRMQENLHYYLRQATRAQEEERKRIALELHDETIQDLVALSRQVDLLSTKGKEISSENRLLLRELQQQTKNIIQSLRHLSQDLRPPTLDRLGLLPALGHLASETTKLGISTKVSVLGPQRRLSEEVETTLFRIAQEAIRNIWRHSQANRAEITVEFIEKKIKVVISDDGKGFLWPEAKIDLTKAGKLGLVGMQERVALINGRLLILSEPGKGTSITVEAPS
jgi:PAS domain S-box-containing protein